MKKLFFLEKERQVIFFLCNAHMIIDSYKVTIMKIEEEYELQLVCSTCMLSISPNYKDETKTL